MTGICSGNYKRPSHEQHLWRNSSSICSVRAIDLFAACRGAVDLVHTSVVDEWLVASLNCFMIMDAVPYKTCTHSSSGFCDRAERASAEGSFRAASGVCCARLGTALCMPCLNKPIFHKLIPLPSPTLRYLCNSFQSYPLSLLSLNSFHDDQGGPVSAKTRRVIAIAG